MSINETIKRKLAERGYTKSINEAMKEFFASDSMEGEDGDTPVPEWEDGTWLKFKTKGGETTPVNLKGDQGEEGEVPTYILGSQEPLVGRISVFCPSLTSDSNGLLSIYLTSTGEEGGEVLFKDLSQCKVSSTAFTPQGTTSNNSVPILAIRDYDNNTGRLRIVVKRARGTLLLNSSAFQNGDNISFNLTVSGEKA